MQTVKSKEGGSAQGSRRLRRRSSVVEQRFRKPWVVSSTLTVGFCLILRCFGFSHIPSQPQQNRTTMKRRLYRAR